MKQQIGLCTVRAHLWRPCDFSEVFLSVALRGFVLLAVRYRALILACRFIEWLHDSYTCILL